MDNRIFEFIQKHRIAVLGMPQSEGNLHAATLHYSHIEDPLRFLFITEKTSRKCQTLIDGEAHPASLVVGFSEEEFVTFQSEGSLKIVTEQSELEKVWETHILKYPPAVRRKTDPEFVILQFEPKWWSYRDYKTDPITIITSE